MILSANQTFASDQAVTATAISTNVIDLGTPGTPIRAAAALTQDIGRSLVNILCQVTADFATLTSLTVTLENSAAAGLTSPVVLATESIAVADLIAGKQLNLNYLPRNCKLQYLGLRFTVVGSNATAGNITAGISMGNQDALNG